MANLQSTTSNKFFYLALAEIYIISFYVKSFSFFNHFGRFAGRPRTFGIPKKLPINCPPLAISLSFNPLLREDACPAMGRTMLLVVGGGTLDFKSPWPVIALSFLWGPLEPEHPRCCPAA